MIPRRSVFAMARAIAALALLAGLTWVAAPSRRGGGDLPRSTAVSVSARASGAGAFVPR